jgi:hypothetical protein
MSRHVNAVPVIVGVVCVVAVGSGGTVGRRRIRGSIRKVSRGQWVSVQCVKSNCRSGAHL